MGRCPRGAACGCGLEQSGGGRRFDIFLALTCYSSNYLNLKSKYISRLDANLDLKIVIDAWRMVAYSGEKWEMVVDDVRYQKRWLEGLPKRVGDCFDGLSRWGLAGRLNGRAR